MVQPSSASSNNPEIVHLSSKTFLGLCVVVAAFLGLAGATNPWPAWLIAAEVLGTVVALFLFGSMKYHLEQNTLVSGMALVLWATTWGLFCPGSAPSPMPTGTLIRVASKL